MSPWLWGLLCFWDTQKANPPHSPAVGGVGEFVDCCISALYFCYETECIITTLFCEEQNTLRYQNTLQNVTRVFCVKSSRFFFLLNNCKAGFSG